MESNLNSPKSFGKILDTVFQLFKGRFKEFMTILLILLGPLYLLRALIGLMLGQGLFRGEGGGAAIWDQIIDNFNAGTAADPTLMAAGIGVSLLNGFTSLIEYLLLPIGWAAILLAINHLRKNEPFTVKGMIKAGFSRFWPILGSSILFGLMVFGLVFIPMMILVFIAVAAAVAEPVAGLILTFILGLAIFIGIGYLLVRWSFYLASVALGEETPGFSRSWRLTKKRAWPVFGLFVVLGLIIMAITFVFEMVFGLILGSSVLYSLIISVVGLVTSLLYAVGYAVVYFDLRARHEADDLKDMIDDYHVGN